MILIKSSIVCLLFYIALAKEEDVLDFGDYDFQERILQHDVALVMFYAPWCGHCKKLKPEFAKAAEDLMRNDPPVTLVKVDCTQGGKETCNTHGVNGYPTLKIFRKGEISQEYNGPRDANGIVKYMKSQVGPSSKELKSNDDLQQFLQNDEVSVIGYFESETDLKIAFLKLADKLRDKVRFAHTTYKDIIEKQGIKNGIVLYRPPHLHNKFEDNSIIYAGKSVITDISNFITNNYHGIVGHRKSDNRQDFNNPLIVAYYNVDYVKNPKGTNYWRNRVLKVAKQFKDKITFAISSKDEFQHELNEYGVDYIKGDKPIILARDDKNAKFVMESEFTLEAFEEFIKKLLDNKLEPYLKSEPIPETNDESVKIAVAKNFDDIVLNNNKDTLIEFYAPWCGHCKKIAPVYDELGQKMKDEDIAIVKIDATANDVPSLFEVRGFPTFYWLSKDSKDAPLKYDGGRELKDFIKYISKQATNELKGYDRKGAPKASKTEL